MTYLPEYANPDSKQRKTPPTSWNMQNQEIRGRVGAATGRAGGGATLGRGAREAVQPRAAPQLAARPAPPCRAAYPSSAYSSSNAPV